MMGCGGSTDTSPTDAQSASATTTTDTSGQYRIVDSNQTSCFDSSSGNTVTCAGSGQDGEFSGRAQSYSDNSDGTITDNVTTLMWTQSPDLNNDSVVDTHDKQTQADATSYCASLSLAGYSDWRLPDIKTLYSLMDFTGTDPSGVTSIANASPFMNDNFFEVGYGDEANGERFIDGQYATTTTYVSVTNLGMGGTATMFGINFVDGRIKGYPTSNDFYVLCVRGNGNYGLNNFTDNGDQTISDAATGLMWQKTDAQSTDFDNAIAGCINASTAGYSDWRLPDIKELHSIVDYSRSPDTSSSAAINPIFSSTGLINEGGQSDYGYYWSSTTHVAYTGNNGQNGSYMCFGRCVGDISGTIYDVHGAGAQRSNDKLDVSQTSGASMTGAYYYKGPQGDILRNDNFYRCVRDI